METYLVRGLDKDGNVFYYTGRAGNNGEWVSPNYHQAFTYTLIAARRKALEFNKGTALHGLRFTAYSPDGVE